MGNISQSYRLCGFLLKLQDFVNKNMCRAALIGAALGLVLLNSKNVPMCIEISVGDLRATRSFNRPCIA